LPQHKSVTYDPKKHHRQSIRLPGYDYSRPGLYYVTICVRNGKCILGNIKKGKMILNKAGRCVNNLWLELPIRFPMIKLNAFIVMPNHIHGIIKIDQSPEKVGAGIAPPRKLQMISKKGAASSTSTLGNIIRIFKSISAHQVNRLLSRSGALWQRNYYEHIIRNEIEWECIYKYIQANPMNWDIDREKTKNYSAEMEQTWQEKK